MGVMRSILLKASESRWLATHLPNYPFARRAVKKFMPGERVEDALQEAAVLAARRTGTVITRLGENITQLPDAEAVTAHYIEVLHDIRARQLPTHVSVKLTQLGLDIDPQHATRSVIRLRQAAEPDTLWIDMESTRYTQVTIDTFNAARDTGPNVGLCLQAYLKRTIADLTTLLNRTTAIRLVKGAYMESPDVALADKKDVDENYLRCARLLLEAVQEKEVGHVPAFATHDVAIIRQITQIADKLGLARDRYEFQLLYGINVAEQKRLAEEGFRIRVLISYGEAWFAWYMRRLAERPANVLFLLRSL